MYNKTRGRSAEYVSSKNHKCTDLSKRTVIVGAKVEVMDAFKTWTSGGRFE